MVQGLVDQLAACGIDSSALLAPTEPKTESARSPSGSSAIPYTFSALGGTVAVLCNDDMADKTRKRLSTKSVPKHWCHSFLKKKLFQKTREKMK
jgi:hypothetical protein